VKSPLAVPSATVTTIPIVGGGLFPVRRIYTIGRNYLKHAKEVQLGGGATSVPGISLKPTDSIVAGGGNVAYPAATRQLEPEVELVLAIGRAGTDIARDAALDHIFGYAVGLDMIRRDVLKACIESHHSWDLCKSFSGSSPVSPIVPVTQIGHPCSGSISLTVNGERVQSADLSEQIWNSSEIVARISHFDRLEPGDLIFTGTPQGPRAVRQKDFLLGHIEGIGDLRVTIV
jgi:fumarylpyruvate hydrolase